MASELPSIGTSSNTSPKVSLLANFTFFPKLAPELRDMIWKLAISRARVIKLTNSKKSELSSYKLYARHRTPPLLHTNRESRTIALTFYIRAFSSRIGHPIYFDFARDYLYLGSWTISHFNRINRYHQTPADEMEERLVTYLMVAKQILFPLLTLHNYARLFPSLKSLDIEAQKSAKCPGSKAYRLQMRLDKRLREERAELFPDRMTEKTKITYWISEDIEGFAEGLSTGI